MSGVITDKSKNKASLNKQTEEQYLCSDANDDMAAVMVEAKKYISGTKLEGQYVVPRFGLLSLKAQNTPMYVYDHPSLKKITNTAFTDGVHTFVDADFLRTLVKEEEASKGTSYGVEPLILHELMHMLLGHTTRLRHFDPILANKAEDYVINAKLQLSFPDMKWCPTIAELGLGFKAGEAEKYATLSEETVARQLLAEENKKKEKEKEKKDGKGQQGQQGQGGSGGQNQGKGEKGEKQDGKGEKGDKQDGNGQQDGEYSGIHHIPLEDLIKTLEEAGLQNVLDKLELPESDDIESIAKIEENVQLKDIECIEKAAAQKSQMGGKYPGAHIVDAAAERIKGLTEGKLEWKLGLKEWILGSGMRFRLSEEEPDLIFHVDAKDMNLDNEIYTGSNLPHSPEEAVLCLIDTSGSVSNEQLKEFISEILNLKKGVSGVSDTASEVIVLSADTVIRGQPVEINDSNVDDMLANGMNIFGRGGTNLAHSLKAAMELDLLKEKKISSVVYFTDLCDIPPTKKDFQEYIDKGMAIAFITSKHTYQEEFAKAVKDFARVYSIEDGMSVDLTENNLDTDVNTRRNKIR